MKISLSTSNKLVNDFPKASKEVKKVVTKLVSRELPNCIGAVDEIYGTVNSGRIKYYAEDLAQMAKMSIKERIEYKGKLIEEGRYYR